MKIVFLFSIDLDYLLFEEILLNLLLIFLGRFFLIFGG